MGKYTHYLNSPSNGKGQKKKKKWVQSGLNSLLVGKKIFKTSCTRKLANGTPILVQVYKMGFKEKLCIRCKNKRKERKERNPATEVILEQKIYYLVCHLFLKRKIKRERALFKMTIFCCGMCYNLKFFSLWRLK